MRLTANHCAARLVVAAEIAGGWHVPLVVAPREAQGDSTMAEPSVEKKKKRERARTGRLQKSKLVYSSKNNTVCVQLYDRNACF